MLALDGNLDDLKAYDPATLDEWVMAGAAKGGHMDVVDWAYTAGIRPGTWVFTYAALSGNIETLQQLHDRGHYKCDERAGIFAAMNGHYEVLMWLADNGYPINPRGVRDSAVSHFRPVPKPVQTMRTKNLHGVRRFNGMQLSYITADNKSKYKLIIDWVNTRYNL